MCDVGDFLSQVLLAKTDKMSSESAIQKRNMESSILFMQQEHAAILKGLHEEIGRLQKRCTGESPQSIYRFRPLIVHMACEGIFSRKEL